MKTFVLKIRGIDHQVDLESKKIKNLHTRRSKELDEEQLLHFKKIAPYWNK